MCVPGPFSRCLRGLVIALFIAFAPPVLAQNGDEASQTAQDLPLGADAAELQALVETLENEKDRQAFVAKLKALIAAKRADGKTESLATQETLGTALLQVTADRLTAVTVQVEQAGSALRALPGAVLSASEALADPETRNRWLGLIGEVLAVLAAGWVAAWLARRILAKPRARLAPQMPPGLVLRIVLLAGRAVIDAVPIAAFAAAAWALMPVLGLAATSSLVTVTLVNAALLSRFASLAGRAVLAPETPVLRFSRVDDAMAAYLYGWLRRFAVTGIYGFFGLQAVHFLGLNPGAYAVLLKLLGLVLAGMAIVFVLDNRKRVAAWLGGQAGETGQVASLRRRLAELWHILAMIYIFAAYLVWALGVQGGFPFLARATVLSLLAIGAARALGHGLHRLYDRGIGATPALGAAYSGLEERLKRYLPKLRRITDIVLLAGTGFAILDIWGARVFGLLATELGQDLSGAVVSLALVFALAMLVWEVANAFLERLDRHAAEGRISAKRSARMQTLLPLLRNALRILILTVAILIGLAEIGVNIAPLLAGAGVIGLAVGFGAQTLVKDVITGVFILAEDSLSIGDWVEAGGHSGEVENLTIRTMTLRDLSGQVHVVPFSEVTSILNMARDYGQAVIDVNVAYRENTDAVTAMLEEVAKELRADPEWGPSILGDMEVFGVNDLGESNVTIRVRMKTAVLMHWAVRREFLRRAKKLFDARGVEIPYPHRTLYFGVDKEGSAPPARVAMQDDRRARVANTTVEAETAEPETPTGTAPDTA